jgi:hypothetical protein
LQGICSSWIFLGTFVGLWKIESFDLGGIFIATMGAIVLLIIHYLPDISRKTHPADTPFVLP